MSVAASGRQSAVGAAAAGREAARLVRALHLYGLAVLVLEQHVTGQLKKPVLAFALQGVGLEGHAVEIETQPERPVEGLRA